MEPVIKNNKYLKNNKYSTDILSNLLYNWKNKIINDLDQHNFISNLQLNYEETKIMNKHRKIDDVTLYYNMNHQKNEEKIIKDIKIEYFDDILEDIEYIQLSYGMCMVDKIYPHFFEILRKIYNIHNTTIIPFYILIYGLPILPCDDTSLLIKFKKKNNKKFTIKYDVYSLNTTNINEIYNIYNKINIFSFRLSSNYRIEENKTIYTPNDAMLYYLFIENNTNINKKITIEFNNVIKLEPIFQETINNIDIYTFTKSVNNYYHIKKYGLNTFGMYDFTIIFDDQSIKNVTIYDISLELFGITNGLKYYYL